MSSLSYSLCSSKLTFLYVYSGHWTTFLDIIDLKYGFILFQVNLVIFINFRKIVFSKKICFTLFLWYTFNSPYKNSPFQIPVNTVGPGGHILKSVGSWQNKKTKLVVNVKVI